jgi:hypothetical protein
MNIEQKTEALRKRWEELQSKTVTPKPPATPPADANWSNKKIGKPDYDNPTTIAEAADYISRFLRSYAPLAHSNRGVQRGGKNENERLRSLKEPITWVGNLAVGEDKYIKGLWKIVPPVGISVAYSGEGAKEEALKRAESIRELY